MPKPFILPPEAVWPYVFVAPSISMQITSLSPRSQDRREAEGTFPRAVKLGEGRRKARVLQEIIDWNRARIAERDGEAAS